MKKIFLVFVFSVFSFVVNAQDTGFSVGSNIAIPLGDTSNSYSISFGVDLDYMFTTEEQINYGFATGYHTFSGKTILGVKTPYRSFIPLALAVRYDASEKVVIGADLGYGIGMRPSGNKGGFYYKPKITYDIGKNKSLNVFYSGISGDNGTFSNIGLGIMFKL